MKKQLSLLALLAFFFFEVNAQVEVHVGARFGINLTGISINDAVDTVNTSTLKTGTLNFVAELRFGNRFSIQSELAFLKKGDKIDETIDIDLGSLAQGNIRILREEKMQYLEIPVLLKYDFVPEKLFDVQLYAGTTFGFLQSRTVVGSVVSTFNSPDGAGGTETTKETVDLNEITNIDTDPSINKTEIGLLLGGALRVDAGPGRITLDVRLGTGLTPYQEYKDDNGVDIKAVNKNTAISLGYLFSFGQ